MSDFQQLYALWDQFLSVWPASRLSSMTLDQYVQAGSKDSFTWWLEIGLETLGSVRGGTAFKFGVFSRKDKEEKYSSSSFSYSDTHGWYPAYGNSAREAFETVRGNLLQLVGLAQQGDLDGIEAFGHFGESTKWKIAFHYQNRDWPCILNIFTKPALKLFVGETGNARMAALQKAALAQWQPGMGVLEMGQAIWAQWSQKNLTVWKLSHGPMEFTVAEREHYLQAELGVMHRATRKGQAGHFETLPVGTLFFLCHGNENLVLIGQFISMPDPCEKDEGWLQRHYRVLKTAIRSGGYGGPKKGWSPGYPSTFMQVQPEDLALFEKSLLKPFFGTDLAELASLIGDPFFTVLEGTTSVTVQAPDLPRTLLASEVQSVRAVASKPIMRPVNCIYYGPPGTGKTHKLNGLLRKYTTEKPDAPAALLTPAMRIQFIAEKFGNLTWWEGAAAALYDMNGKGKVADIADHPFIEAIVAAKKRTEHVKQTLWGTLQHHTLEASNTVNMKLRMTPQIFDKSPESVWQLAGDWKEACADLVALVDQLKAGVSEAGSIQRYSFVTFHQSYGYEEFVEGLRPVLRDENDSGEVVYEVRPGVFKQLCNRARLAPDQRFAMVIDEINRGNISKIFGELITLIEDNKRDPLNGQPPPVEVQLPCSGELFSVPANVDIYGTMNTADRSLALLDTALRRRFDFEALMPDTREEKDPADPDSAPLAGLVVAQADASIDVRHMLARMNERIEALYDRDHCIGHAWLMPLRDIDDQQARFLALKNIFRKRIVPLLEEYFFEDWQKIRLVLADNQKRDSGTHFICESGASEQDLTSLFGSNHELEPYSTKPRYAIQEAAFDNPMSYIGVYRPALA